jgi:Family of unknown function (DUF5995)
VTRHRAGALALAVVSALVVVPAHSSGATTQTPPWERIAKSLTPALDPTSTNPCNRGSVGCIDKALKEMKRRERVLTARCDHNVMFAYTYRVTTAMFRAGWPRDFASPTYIAHLDGTFAERYFDAYDTWNSGRGEVPEAWRIAFDAAEARSVSGLGDMLLGINAHISRDLPFVLTDVGLVRPDGSSALDDYNLANQVIVDVQNTVLDGAARRFDPDVAMVTIPGLFVGRGGFLALIAAWRGEAWSRAQQLAAATTPAARQLVVDQIEGVAQARALAIATATTYLPLVSSTDARDRFCRDQG